VSRELIKVEQDVKEAQQELEQNRALAPANPEALDDASFYGQHAEYIDELLTYHPTIAVLEAWQILEQEVRALANRNQEGQDIDQNTTISSLTKQLEAAGLLPSSLRDSILRLQSARNVITHTLKNLPTEEVVSSVDSAFALASTLRRL
jgi:uncharacterized protein YutE (UPF0331/DUF86 family)